MFRAEDLARNVCFVSTQGGRLKTAKTKNNRLPFIESTHAYLGEHFGLADLPGDAVKGGLKVVDIRLIHSIRTINL